MQASYERRHKGRILSANKNPMSYIKDFEVELTKKLESGADTASIVRWISEKVLASYKNGIAAGKRGAHVQQPAK